MSHRLSDPQAVVRRCSSFREGIAEERHERIAETCAFLAAHLRSGTRAQPIRIVGPIQPDMDRFVWGSQDDGASVTFDRTAGIPYLRVHRTGEAVLELEAAYYASTRRERDDRYALAAGVHLCLLALRLMDLPDEHSSITLGERVRAETLGWAHVVRTARATADDHAHASCQGRSATPWSPASVGTWSIVGGEASALTDALGFAPPSTIGTMISHSSIGTRLSPIQETAHAAGDPIAELRAIAAYRNVQP